MTWRVGSKVTLNVYDGDRPVCQCHNEDDARAIVQAMNEHNETWTDEEGTVWCRPTAHAYAMACKAFRLVKETQVFGGPVK